MIGVTWDIILCDSAVEQDRLGKPAYYLSHGQKSVCLCFWELEHHMRMRCLVNAHQEHAPTMLGNTKVGSIQFT
ncbi:MAG: hypothetical protein ABIP48_16470, partial [Planctomycetota bacterium]